MNIKSAWILSFGLIVAAIVFGVFFYGSRQTDQTVRVVGYSTYDFEANIVKWSFTFSETVPVGNLTTGYQNMNDKLQTLKKFGMNLQSPIKISTYSPLLLERCMDSMEKLKVTFSSRIFSSSQKTLML